jgi:serine/threonine protein kinase
MASLTDDDDIEESVQDGVPSKKVQSRDLKSGVLLGKGASSFVYETTWKGKSYARKDFLRVPSDIFEREAAFLVALDDHPNVVRTYGWTVDEGSCSLVVELMDDDLLNLMRKRNVSQLKHFSGPSDASQRSHLIDLHKFVEDGKNAPAGTGSESVASTSVYRFSMPEALHVMLQIAEGIVFLHDHGVAHGDLKPKNILVTPSERAISGSLDQDVAFKLKVADFGLIGTKIKSKSLVSRRARRLEILRWRAPELFKDMSPLKEGDLESFTDSSDWDSDSSDGRIGGRIHKFSYGKLARADVYSFALTCSQILTGEDPYQGIGLNDLVRRIPLGLRPGLPRRCPAQLSDLINRCWGEELKRPTFIGIRSELKDLQASLMGGPMLEPYLLCIDL